MVVRAGLANILEEAELEDIVPSIAEGAAPYALAIYSVPDVKK